MILLECILIFIFILFHRYLFFQILFIIVNNEKDNHESMNSKKDTIKIN